MPARLLPPYSVTTVRPYVVPRYRLVRGTPSAAISGTATASMTESQVVAGGKTIIITLDNAQWVPTASFDAQRANIIAGIDSAQSEALGWDNVVKALQGVAGVVRTSDSVVTITLDAQATYSITANETITVTVPAAAINESVAIVGSPTFTVTEGAGVAAKAFRRTLLGVGV